MNLYFKLFKSDLSKFNSPSLLSSCMDNIKSDTAHSCSQVGIYSFPWDSPNQGIQREVEPEQIIIQWLG